MEADKKFEQQSQVLQERMDEVQQSCKEESTVKTTQSGSSTEDNDTLSRDNSSTDMLVDCTDDKLTFFAQRKW